MSTEERSVNQPEEQPSLSEQRLIRRAKLKELQDAGQDPFQITKFVVKHHSADIKEGFEALEGAMTSVAGRIMSKRGMGKAVFCDLQDGKGRIQLYVRVDELGEEAFAKFKKTDIGPISPKDDDSNTDDDTKTGIDGSMDDSDSKQALLVYLLLCRCRIRNRYTRGNCHETARDESELILQNVCCGQGDNQHGRNLQNYHYCEEIDSLFGRSR